MMNVVEQPGRRRRVPRIAALASLALMALCLPGAASAQWSAPDAQGNISSTNTGNVGIGNSSPSLKLTVGSPTRQDGRVNIEGADNGTHVLFNTGGANRGRIATLVNGLHFQAYSGAWSRNDLFIRDDGNVGIGTTAPGLKLDVNGSARAGQLVFAQGFASSGKGGYMFAGTGGAGAVDAEVGFQAANSGLGGSSNDGPYVTARGNAFSRIPNQRGTVFVMAGSALAGPASGEGELQFWTNAAQRVVVTYAGNVGIGTSTPSAALDVAGNINVSGNINAKYQDVAEWVPSTRKLAPGTVVVLDPARENHVTPSSAPYDTRVAGVVSAQPGISLGEAAPDKSLVATTGRVRVRVDATRAPILIGDLIVTSDAPGVAMKSEPVSLGGVSIHRPGTIIGKALQALDKGTGEILVLLSLQ